MEISEGQLPRDIKGKTAIVTGGSRGIGAAIVTELIDDGCNVIINHRRNVGKGAAQVKQLIQYAEEKGVYACSVLGDISVRRDVEKMFKGLQSEFQQIDHLILNAGQTPFKEFQDFNKQDWKVLLDTNLVGNVGCVQGVIPMMKKGGSIVFITSTGSRRVMPHYPMGVIKAALEHLVRYLDYELHSKGIRVNAVCGGLVKTDTFEQLEQVWPGFMQMLETRKRDYVLDPSEIASVVSFLCSDKSRAIQGSVILADRGITLE
ncbi:MAG: NAD(P)-dependent dehydrogenase (short-subunit alcohol dehydrogenase family) [Arenicella sp.]|jgi:NAD(P)-dependent dehydrogenase (short-subunit alcohol dehydrogenase family)